MADNVIFPPNERIEGVWLERRVYDAMQAELEELRNNEYALQLLKLEKNLKYVIIEEREYKKLRDLVYTYIPKDNCVLCHAKLFIGEKHTDGCVLEGVI